MYRNERKRKVNKELLEADELTERLKQYKVVDERYRTPKGSAITEKTFDQLPLSQKTLENLGDYGFANMTVVQATCIPHALKGEDVVGIATTGTGKTLAYIVPLIEFIFRNKWQPTDGLGALVLVPTRELAMQVFTVLAGIGKDHAFNAGLITSGKDFKEEAKAIWGLNVIVATPGRLIQHLDQTPGFNPSTCRFFVLDEVDLMLSLGFMRQIETIMEALPPSEGDDVNRRQTMLLSATAPDSNESLRELISSATNPKITKIFRVSTDSEKEQEFREAQAKLKENNSAQDNNTGKKTKKKPTPEQLTEEYMLVDHHEKLCVLYDFLRNIIKSRKRTRIIVFLASARQVRFLQEVYKELPSGAKIIGPTCSVFSLSGRDTETHRESVFRQFRDAYGQGGNYRSNEERAPPVQILLTTDITARGMDYPEVDIVVQVDLPTDVKTYIHKVGRAARMMPNEVDVSKPYCKNGRAILFVAPNQTKFLRILKKKGIEPTLAQTPGKDPQTGELDPSAEVFKNALASMCARSSYIKYLSEKALKSYCKSCSVSKDCKIPVKKMPVKKMAEFYGLSTYATAQPLEDPKREESEGELFTRVTEEKDDEQPQPEIGDSKVQRMEARYNKKGLKGYFSAPNKKRSPP